MLRDCWERCLWLEQRQGEGWLGCTQSRASTWHWNILLEHSQTTGHRTQGGWWLSCWVLGSLHQQKGDTQHQGFHGLRATSPAATLLLTVQGNSTLTAFINKISCSSSSPSYFCKEDICFCFSCPERNNSGSWRVTEQHPRQAIIFCPSYLL